MESSTISNTAFQEALQRARKLAAKIGQPGGSNEGIKRPIEDDSQYSPDTKKMNFGSNVGQMGFKPQQRPQKDQLYLNGMMFNGDKVQDIMLPGNKVGFVIGKGGEMIRQLQEKACVKMVIYQETNVASDQDKQLRITGPPDKVDYAKQLINDLLIEKEQEMLKMNKKPNFNPLPASALNEYGSSRITFFEYPVSPQLIGLVIGKGGETIRKIQADSGCKVQFDTTKVDAQGNKICQFTGTQESVNRALDMVKEIIEQVTGGQGTVEEMRLVVPTSRTGTVIGRGGETIRALKQQSGCNIELDKNFQSNNDEKCFILRGSADKITYAQQLVTDKVGGHATVVMNTLQNNPLYSGDGQYNYLTSQIYANQLGQGQSQYYWPQGAATDPKAIQDQYAMWAAYYAQYAQYSQGAAAAAITGAGGDPTQQAAAAAASATTTATPAAGQDYESMYQQWIEYYKALGMTKEAESMEQKLKEYKQSQKTTGSGTSSASATSEGQNHHSEGSSQKNGQSD